MKKQVFIFLAVLGFMMSACAVRQTPEPETVQGAGVIKGEWVRVNYTCSAKNHGLIDTTDGLAGQDPGIEKSRIFRMPVTPGPVKLLAGMNQPGQVNDKLKDLTPEIHNQIARTLVYKKYGAVYETKIDAAVPSGMMDSNRFRYIPREKQVPRIQTIPLADYIARHKSEPISGKLMYKNAQNRVPECVWAKITAVDEQQVTLELIPEDESNPEARCDVHLPWGTPRLVDRGDRDMLTTVIESQIGLLVRTGPVAGRVVEINDKTIKIDYGHPFAGETLKCRVEILDKEEKE